MNTRLANLKKIFEPLIVLDLSSILAGPLSTSFFSELGSTVYKIENKNTFGDATRQWKLPEEDPENSVSAYYASANFNKKVILLNYDNADDYAILRQYIAKADIIVSNLQKKVGRKYNLTPENLALANSSAVIVQLNAYTYDDPRPGYDLVMQAETGWISMTGVDSSNLAKLPVALIDILASHQIKEAVLIGLLQRMSDNSGSIFHVSLYDSAITALANQASNFLMVQHVPQPLGTLHPNIAPYGDLFAINDGTTFMLAVGSDYQFEKLWFTLTSRKDIPHNFVTNTSRVQHRQELNASLYQLFISRDHDIFVRLQEQNIPFCMVRSLDQVLSNPSVEPLILVDKTTDNQSILKRVSTIAFVKS